MSDDIPLKSNSPRIVSAKVINSGLFVVPALWQSDEPMVWVRRDVPYLRCVEVPGNSGNIAPHEGWWCTKGLVWFVAQDHRQHVQEAIWYLKLGPQTRESKQRLALYGLQERRNILCNFDQRMMKRCAQSTRKHQVQLVVQKLCQVGTNGGSQHANALKHRFLRRRLLPNIK